MKNISTVLSLNKSFCFEKINVRKTQGGKIMIEMEEPNNKNIMVFSKKDALILAEELERLANEA